jgi:hypothetical protein
MFSRFRALSCAFILILAGCSNKTDIGPTGEASSQLAVTLNSLTQAVRKYSVEQRKVPKDLQELVTNRYLTTLPEPPAGKKFAINKNLQVYVVSQ